MAVILVSPVYLLCVFFKNLKALILQPEKGIAPILQKLAIYQDALIKNDRKGDELHE